MTPFRFLGAKLFEAVHHLVDRLAVLGLGVRAAPSVGIVCHGCLPELFTAREVICYACLVKKHVRREGVVVAGVILVAVPN